MGNFSFPISAGVSVDEALLYLGWQPRLWLLWLQPIAAPGGSSFYPPLLDTRKQFKLKILWAQAFKKITYSNGLMMSFRGTAAQNTSAVVRTDCSAWAVVSHSRKSVMSFALLIRLSSRFYKVQDDGLHFVYLALPPPSEPLQVLLHFIWRTVYVSGRARSWSEKQRRQNLWTKKGYDLAYKACMCKCKRGHLRKDLDWEIQPETLGRLINLAIFKVL